MRAIITTGSRMEVERGKFIETDFVISITDTSLPEARLEGTDNILRLSFHDIEKDILLADNGKSYYAMTKEDGVLVVDFLKLMKDENTHLFVHCEAGISRSAGIAAAISKYWYNNDSRFFRDKCPNRNCYKIVLERLHNQKIYPEFS